MKVSIPLDSTLCTDSHPNEIKDPTRDRDLFSKNRSYLYNKHLTNPRKEIVPAGDYITTRGDRLTVIPGSEKTQIYNNGVVIADVLSLGIEDISYLDKDDAVVDGGFLWTVQKTLTGYIIEQTDLTSQEATQTTVEQTGILDVRFVRNTHKIITRNQDGTVTIDGQVFDDTDMRSYLANFSGEFTAVEVNGKIYFGYNNPSGVTVSAPEDTLNLTISASTNGWTLADKIPDQDKGYTINITVSDGVQIGAGSNGFALDLLTMVSSPMNHVINLHLGNNVVIIGQGGQGASVSGSARSNSGLTNGLDGFAAINVGSLLNITGAGIIQGGGGGGASAIFIHSMSEGRFLRSNAAGGGGAGLPAGIGGIASGGNENKNGSPGTSTTGGNPGDGDYARGGYGGNPGNPGGAALDYTWRSSPGQSGAAVRIVSPAILTVDGPTLLGGTVTV